MRAFCATMTWGDTRAAEKRAHLRELSGGRLRLLASVKLVYAKRRASDATSKTFTRCNKTLHRIITSM